MPYPNEHAARVKSPGLFKDGKDEWARNDIAPGIAQILGHLKKPKKGSKPNATTVQAYRFDKNKFSADEARKWLKDHNIKYMLFEPASEKKESVADEVAKMTLKKMDELKRR